jgi:hypothetical protein
MIVLTSAPPVNRQHDRQQQRAGRRKAELVHI